MIRFGWLNLHFGTDKFIFIWRKNRAKNFDTSWNENIEGKIKTSAIPDIQIFQYDI